MEEKTPHKRRVRYSGTHPKHFHEKYKELNPEKYADDVAHVISRGATPAGMHISIMVQEILDFLQIRPGMNGADATLGYGGHTRAMLEKLEGKGHITAFDVDPIESAKTKDRLAAAGYGEYFTHRLGHFIGQTEHERGDVSGISQIVAQPGMIFSVEPGVYLPDEFGVRIEDLVLVNKDGCERLNKVDKHWKTIG
jgi:16S rRNA (cytosine1402-N4)-methyltransferase